MVVVRLHCSCFPIRGFHCSFDPPAHYWRDSGDAEVVAEVGEEGLQNDDWRQRHDRGPNLLGEVARHRILDHIAWKKVPMTAVQVAVTVVLELDGLEVVNVEIPSTNWKEDMAENEHHGVQGIRNEKHEVTEHGGHTSEMMVVGRHEVGGKQRTMAEERHWTGAQASGILPVDRPSHSWSRFERVSSPMAGRASHLRQLTWRFLDRKVDRGAR